MNPIEIYLQSLSGTLNNFGVTEEYNGLIVESIRTRMLSLLWSWKDKAFRNAVLFTGTEEGVRYDPKVDNQDIAPFVVVTVRNSLLETASSLDFPKAGLQAELTIKQIKEITSKAIEYFSSIDFNQLSEQVQQSSPNFYQEISQKYPCAFTALKAISSNDKTSIYYNKAKAEPYNIPRDLIDRETKVTDRRDDYKEITLSGIDGKIDNGLYNHLQSIARGELEIFYSDSLKSISRNFEKLLIVMEFVLTRDKTVATANYLFRNGYVEKRKRLLKPLSGKVDIQQNIIHLKDAGPKHRKILEDIKSM